MRQIDDAEKETVPGVNRAGNFLNNSLGGSSALNIAGLPGKVKRARRQDVGGAHVLYW